MLCRASFFRRPIPLLITYITACKVSVFSLTCIIVVMLSEYFFSGLNHVVVFLFEGVEMKILKIKLF